MLSKSIVFVFGVLFGLIFVFFYDFVNSLLKDQHLFWHCTNVVLLSVYKYFNLLVFS